MERRAGPAVRPWGRAWDPRRGYSDEPWTGAGNIWGRSQAPVVGEPGRCHCRHRGHRGRSGGGAACLGGEAPTVFLLSPPLEPSPGLVLDLQVLLPPRAPPQVGCCLGFTW